MKANRAIIVAHDGGIHIAPDTSKPWVDTNGDDHFQINRAHVANGSVQTIWVKCNTNREYVRKESDELPEHIEEGLVSKQELLFSGSLQNVRREDEPKHRTRTCMSPPSLEALLKSMLGRRTCSRKRTGNKERRRTTLRSSLLYTKSKSVRKSKKMVRFLRIHVFCEVAC